MEWDHGQIKVIDKNLPGDERLRAKVLGYLSIVQYKNVNVFPYV